MDRLVALPVSGDSYLLQRCNWNVLVDGGHSSRSLASTLACSRLGVKHLHIAVCTHADLDHAGGFTHFLDRSPVTIGEFWLPGSWSEALPSLLNSPRTVIDELVRELETFRLGKDSPPEEEIDAFEVRVHSEIARMRSAFRHDRDANAVFAGTAQQDEQAGLAWLRNLAPHIAFDETDTAAAAREFRRGRRLIRYRGIRSKIGCHGTAFWLSLIDTAERIRSIAVQALRHRVRVRWFDYGEFARRGRAQGGERDLLVPLNAVELQAPHSPAARMPYSVRLAPVDEECLVFSSPAYNWPDALGVVFTGDSPLGTGPGFCNSFLDKSANLSPWTVATAPHHGSENSAAAYAHLGERTNVVFWLRSGDPANHPGASFRRLPPAQRGCTGCLHASLEKKVAEVRLSDGVTGWPFLRILSHDCTC